MYNACDTDRWRCKEKLRAMTPGRDTLPKHTYLLP